MNNLEIAAVLAEVAALLAQQKADTYKIRAYRRAAQTIAHWPEPIELVWRRGALTQLPGIGKVLAGRISELLATGGLGYLEELQAAAPAPEPLSGTDAAPAYALWPLATALTETLRGGPGCVEAAVAGALRRMAPVATGITLVAAVQSPEAMIAHLSSSPLILGLTPRSPLPGAAATDRILSGTTPTGWKVVIWLVSPARFAAALLAATGSDAHISQLLQRGPLSLTPGTEAEAYRALGLDYIPPELREGTGEIEAAAQGSLPSLVHPGQILGDLHCHTTWSDGLASAAEMARAARRLGYQYLAITDHSQSLRIAGGLTPAQFQAQGGEIAALNRTGDLGLRLLHGAEVDILKDGRLDLPDAVLAGLDVVVASVHSHMKLDADAMTARIETAMANPHVDILAHPTGRKLGLREAYPLHLERVLALAGRTGTALEINASPARLDLDGEVIRLARAHGVRFVISSDAHEPEELQGLVWGVGQARRGGLTASQVINTWPLEQLLEWLRRPKGR